MKKGNPFGLPFILYLNLNQDYFTESMYSINSTTLVE